MMVSKRQDPVFAGRIREKLMYIKMLGGDHVSNRKKRKTGR